MEKKNTGGNLGGPAVWERWRHLDGGEACVSQVDADLDMAAACVCMVGQGKAQPRNNGLCQHMCPGESHLSSPCPAAVCLTHPQSLPGFRLVLSYLDFSDYF